MEHIDWLGGFGFTNEPVKADRDVDVDHTLRMVIEARRRVYPHTYLLYVQTDRVPGLRRSLDPAKSPGGWIE